MAERLKNKFLDEEKIVDLVVGPDAYKDLPNLLEEINEGRSADLDDNLKKTNSWIYGTYKN